MATLRENGIMAWGKIRRFMRITFSRKRVAEDLARRRGECGRCGACCKIVFKCPAYDDSTGVGRCTIYNDRPGVCGLFPINEQDLRDRDIVMPGEKCGFYFVKDGNGRFEPVMGEPALQPLQEVALPSAGTAGLTAGTRIRGTLKIIKGLLTGPASRNGHSRKD